LKVPEALIPHSRPTFLPEEVEAAAEVLRSGHPAGGPVAARFGAEAAAAVGVGHAVPTSSGTAALHLILAGMGVGPGDEVIIPSYVCTSLVNCCRYVGARPVLVDCRSSDFNMDQAAARAAVSGHTKAIVLPHMFGAPADVDAVAALGVPVIEDCAMAFGASRSGRPVGSMGYACVVSTHATKVLSTGEGGLALTSDDALAERIRDLASYDQRCHYRVRYNYVMSDLQAAVGLCQLRGLPGFIERRREIAARYTRELADLDTDLPQSENKGEHIYYRYVVRVGALGDAIERMAELGVGCKRPVHKPIHRYLGLPDADFPVSSLAADTNLSLPIYPSLSEDDTGRVLAAARSVISNG